MPGAKPKLLVLIQTGPDTLDAEASLKNVAFADACRVVCSDPATERAYRDAGATDLVSTPDAELSPDDADWLLILKSNERVSLDLRDEILEKIAAPAGSPLSYSVRIARHRFGRYLRHGGWRHRETRLLCLCAAENASVSLGRTEMAEAGLDRVLVDFGPRTLSEAISGINLRSEHTDGSPSRVGAIDIFLKPWARFMSRFFFRVGFLDGVPGFVAASLESMELCLVSSKIWARSREES